MSADVCRVCLVNNLNLYGVRNYLQNVYETITREKYNEAGYPVRMCYICLSALRKCHRFMETARDANRSLKQFYNQQCQMAVAKPLSIYEVTKVELVSVDGEGTWSKHDVKEEYLGEVEYLEELSDVDLQTDHCETFKEEDTTEFETDIERNDEIENPNANDISKELKTETEIEETHERDSCVFIFESKESEYEVLKSKETKDEKNIHICDICNKYYTVARSLKQHIILKHPTEAQKKYPKTKFIGEKRFSCNICNYKSVFKGHLTRHLKSHSAPVKCGHCNYRCRDNSLLADHVRRRHTADKPYSCDICDYKCSVKGSLTIHMMRHTGKKPFLCNICGHKSGKKELLMQHMDTHAGERYCDHCSFKSTSKFKLALHMRIHFGKKTFKCRICGVKYDDKNKLKLHMRIHTGEKTHTCNICGFISKSANKSSLKKHMMLHTGEKPFSCHICSFKCIQKNKLHVHILRNHKQGDKQFSCNICSHKFATKSELTDHVSTHTGEKPFSCDLCGSKFLKKFYLTIHLRTHTGEKPYSCNNCSSKYTSKSSLKVHMRTHAGKPFCCDVCGYNCCRKGSLVHHMRTHTGEKPFSCNICGSKYKQKFYLNKHIKKMHSDQKPNPKNTKNN